MAALSARVNARRRFHAIRLFSALMASLAIVTPLDVIGTAHSVESDPRPPARIVSLVPAATEMIFAMHAEDKLAGVSNYDRYPPQVARFPKLGGLLDPDVERLLSLKSDLAIVYGTQTELQQQLARAGIPMFSYVHRDLAEVTRTMRTLGQRIGAKAAADAAATAIEQQIQELRTKVAGRRAPRTLLVIGRDMGALTRVQASGGYGFLHDVLLAAGGADALGDIKRESVQMSTEMILARAPEVIIELHYGDSVSVGDLERERKVWNVLSSIPAVKNGRIHLVVGDEFVVPGPRIVVAVERLARVLHPEVFR